MRTKLARQDRLLNGLADDNNHIAFFHNSPLAFHPYQGHVGLNSSTSSDPINITLHHDCWTTLEERGEDGLWSCRYRIRVNMHINRVVNCLKSSSLLATHEMTDEEIIELSTEVELLLCVDCPPKPTKNPRLQYQPMNILLT